MTKVVGGITLYDIKDIAAQMGVAESTVRSWLISEAALGALRGRSAAMPACCAWHRPRSGQIPQAGLRGVQIVAPRSIIACA